MYNNISGMKVKGEIALCGTEGERPLFNLSGKRTLIGPISGEHVEKNFFHVTEGANLSG